VNDTNWDPAEFQRRLATYGPLRITLWLLRIRATAKLVSLRRHPAIVPITIMGASALVMLTAVSVGTTLPHATEPSNVTRAAIVTDVARATNVETTGTKKTSHAAPDPSTRTAAKPAKKHRARTTHHRSPRTCGCKYVIMTGTPHPARPSAKRPARLPATSRTQSPTAPDLPAVATPDAATGVTVAAGADLTATGGQTASAAAFAAAQNSTVQSTAAVSVFVSGGATGSASASAGASAGTP
jgi:hypothetical protein